MTHSKQVYLRITIKLTLQKHTFPHAPPVQLRSRQYRVTKIWWRIWVLHAGRDAPEGLSDVWLAGGGLLGHVMWFINATLCMQCNSGMEVLLSVCCRWSADKWCVLQFKGKSYKAIFFLHHFSMGQHVTYDTWSETSKYRPNKFLKTSVSNWVSPLGF